MSHDLGLKFTKQTRFLQLFPCGDIIEKEYMDNWIGKTKISKPTILEPSILLCCPLCKREVENCPRYGYHTKMVEKAINNAKLHISSSDSFSKYSQIALQQWKMKHNYDPQSCGNDEKLMKHMILGAICVWHKCTRSSQGITVCDQEINGEENSLLTTELERKSRKL